MTDMAAGHLTERDEKTEAILKMFLIENGFSASFKLITV